MLNMKWYWWVLVVLLVIIIGYILYQRMANRETLYSIESSINESLPETGASGGTGYMRPFRGRRRRRKYNDALNTLCSYCIGNCDKPACLGVCGC
jgi:hypothetical protein